MDKLADKKKRVVPKKQKAKIIYGGDDEVVSAVSAIKNDIGDKTADAVKQFLVKNKGNQTL